MKQWRIAKKLRAAVRAAPQISLCRHASPLRFSLNIAHQMLKHYLGYHPYKLQIVQELKETDSARQKDFWEQFMQIASTGRHTDVAHFELNRCINKQNMRYWLADNPN